jgi:hypothetical protein
MAVTFAYFMPIIAFLLVFILSYAILSRTKILGKNNFIHIFVSFLIAVLFVSYSAMSEVTRLAIPWVAVLLVILFCMLLVVAFVGNMDAILKNKILGVAVIVIILIIFLISAIQVFAPIIKPYLPTSTSEAGAESNLLQVKHVLFNPAVMGMIILLIVAAIASWIVTKK